MMVPTLLLGIYITWLSRKVLSELFHNLAVIFWIAANSIWMCSEFLGVDNYLVYGTITVKQLAMIPFITGVLILAYYYLIYKPRHSQEAATL